MAAVDAHVWQEEVEGIKQYMRQRRRWYSSDLKEILKGKRKIAKLLGALPISMQAVTFLSLIYFISLLLPRFSRIIIIRHILCFTFSARVKMQYAKC
jgi:cellulose synthase/poly-beta-1,6-N-acetylglucosamine synthase-like glycosyltransferase